MWYLNLDLHSIALISRDGKAMSALLNEHKLYNNCQAALNGWNIYGKDRYFTNPSNFIRFCPRNAEFCPFVQASGLVKYTLEFRPRVSSEHWPTLLWFCEMLTKCSLNSKKRSFRVTLKFDAVSSGVMPSWGCLFHCLVQLHAALSCAIRARNTCSHACSSYRDDLQTTFTRWKQLNYIS